METTLTLQNAEGLHARPAGHFVKLASQFQSQIFVEYNGKSANAKSVIHLMSLGLGGNAQFKIKAEGADAETALSKLSELVNNRFGLPHLTSAENK
jgi:phosphotransferase system HPr (HPr) family protein